MMNPTKKGWFESYLASRSEQLFEDYIEAAEIGDREKVIYKWIQPSGLMYGHPVNIPFFDADKAVDFEGTDKMKLILAESFLMSMYATEADGDRLSDQIRKAPGKIIRFYESVFPDVSIKHRNVIGLSRKEDNVAEDLISQRLKVKGSNGQNFWSGFFQNSLLFLDVYYFFRYLESHDSINLPELRKDLESIRFLIVSIIAAAAHANSKIEQEERELFNFFLLAAALSPEKKTRARQIFTEGIDVEQITMPKIDSWLLKKYILELATLTIWSDKSLEDSEMKFLEKLNKKLGFDSEELEMSIFSIEAFVIENWDKVRYLHSKENYQIVGEQMVKKMQVIMNKNKEGIATGIRENRELMELLVRNRMGKLTLEEEETVRKQLIEIVKSIPALVVIALPGTFLTLPVLLKILPEDVLNDLKEEV